MTDTPDPTDAAYIAWCNAEDAVDVAYEAYCRQPVCTPAHDAAFEVWWAAIEALDAARATYYALEGVTP